MRLKLNLVRPGDRSAADLLVTTDPTVSVAELATALRDRDPDKGGSLLTGPLTLSSWDGASYRALRRDSTLAEAGLRSGSSVTVSVDTGATAAPSDAAAVLRVVDGPDLGREFPLRFGANDVGRQPDNDIVLTDPLISKKHVRINVTDTVELVDLGSSNGVEVGGVAVPRVHVSAEDTVRLGDTTIRVILQVRHGLGAAAAAAEPFVRSPRLEPVWVGEKVALPKPPEKPQVGRMSYIPLVMPLVFGAVMFAVTKNATTVLFVALSPLMMVGNLLERRFGAKRAYAEALEAFEGECGEVRTRLGALAEAERAGRVAEHASTRTLLDAAAARESWLWSRRRDRAGWLTLRLGLGSQPSRTTVEIPSSRTGEAVLWDTLVAIEKNAAEVAPVPVMADLTECGAVGVAGPRPHALASARALVFQLIALHSPAEVVLCGIASVTRAADWDWLKWLPHTTSEHSPLKTDHLAAGAGQGSVLLTSVEQVLDTRREAGRDSPNEPALVLLVEDDNGCDRSRIVEIAEHGPAVGVFVIWVAAEVGDLPAACRIFLWASGRSDQPTVVGRTADGTSVQVQPETITAEEALGASRSLSALVDAGARIDDDSDLPASVSTLQIVGRDKATSPEAVIDVWATSGSLPGSGTPSKRRSGLRASVGMASGQSLVLDLREQGPHALVGGTTGAGKSEFLQAWVMGMALEHSPSRVTFLFVDYKGGAAFSECTRLPHCVGLVTDLNQHLVRRALTSLNAELRYREHILQRKKAKDLFELERVGDPETPPSLVIVVDEFAALVNEVPEFVEGVVNVAQRGRSLGVNLILATQRPAGVIKDNLRANTNLRIALRMADEADSDDVVGSKVAAAFPPSIPGRAVAKTGPGRLVPFQSGYVGGWTSEAPPRPSISVVELGFGTGSPWEEERTDDSSAAEGPNDLTRLVDNVLAAHVSTALPVPRRPWLDPLAAVYDVRKSPQSRSDTSLVFGIADDPDNQVQRPVAFEPDADGNMVVFGTGGTGKSTLLRTIALAAGAATRGGHCHVYGLDFGSRGLSMLEGLPHIGSIVNGDDDERVFRLIRHLRSIVEERAERYSAANAGSISDYRRLTGSPDEARILLLVDNIGTFRQGYETGERARIFETFVSLAADGRQVGVHVVVSADRSGAVPTALGSLLQRRLVLRLAGESDYSMMGVDEDVLDGAPPGRGVIDDLEVQVLIMGQSANTAEQSALVSAYGRRLAEMLDAGGDWVSPPPVNRLPELVTLAELPEEREGKPVVGLADDDLEPTAIERGEVMVLAGPPQSGRSTVLLSLVLALARSRPGRRVHLAPAPSDVAAGVAWELRAHGVEEVAEAARKLAGDLLAWHSAAQPLVLVIENLPEFLQSEADQPLQDLIRACRTHGVSVIAEGESSLMMSSWPLLQAVRSGRTGIVLQPEQIEAENLFKTPMPRMTRSQFPVGRGIYVRSGRARRIQFALPEV